MTCCWCRAIAPYDVGDEPGREPIAVILPGNRSETPDGVSLDLPMTHGLRTWGNDPDGEDGLLVGQLRVGRRGRVPDAGGLPPWLVVRGRSGTTRWSSLLLDQLDRDAPGQASLLDRLLDALVVSAVQHWATTADDLPPWLRAGGDREVARALALVHEPAGHAWTLECRSPARSACPGPASRGGSPAAVGESPIAYLSAWRLAWPRTCSPAPTTPSARSRARWATGSPFTFSDAFKRSYGVSPVEHRRRGRSG